MISSLKVSKRVDEKLKLVGVPLKNHLLSVYEIRGQTFLLIQRRFSYNFCVGGGVKMILVKMRISYTKEV